jgi:DNA-binding MarR family transcriptional regulator
MASENPDVPMDHLYASPPQLSAGAAAIAALQVANLRLREADELALRRLGVGPLDARALLHIVQRTRHGLVVRPAELVSTLRVSSAAITKLVDRLVHAGHLERSTHPTDRRAVVLTASEPMKTAISNVYKHIHTPLVTVIDTFSAKELEVIGRFSDRLAEALHEETVNISPTPG